MPRFFITASQIGTRDDGSKTALIRGEDALHITKSLRMKAGEKVTLCDMARREYDCCIASVGETVLLEVEGERECDTEPPYKATLYQALIKGDKFDTVVQKAVECGVSEIVPFISERCIVRLTKKDCEKKIIRWQRIAEEAAKQCGRGIIPEIGSLMTFGEMTQAAAAADTPIFCYEGESARTLTESLKDAKKDGTVAIVIGSEGGFSLKEAEIAEAAGLISTGLGKRILRTETASSFVLACISYALEL